MSDGKLKTNEEDSPRNIQIRALRLVFLLLPPPNYNLLRDLLHFLHSVSLKSRFNKMDAANLGTMFSPHILCPRKVCKLSHNFF